MFKSIASWVRGLFHSYSELLFLQSAWAGAVLLLLTLFRPSLGVAGLVSVASAFLFSRWMGLGPWAIRGGFYTYNPLLVGLSIGALFHLTPLTLFFAAACGVIAFILTFILSRALDYWLRLPALSLPFVVVSSTVYLAAQKYSNLFVTGLKPAAFDLPDLYFPDWASGYFHALGSVFFMPEALAGLALALILLLHSRILFLLSVLGWAAGVGMAATLTGSFADAFRAPASFNHVLTAMALGGIFLVPSRRSLVLSLLAVVLSSILAQATGIFWASFGIPVFTLPFIATVIPFLYFLGIAGYPGMVRVLRRTPEESVCFAAAEHQRFKDRIRPLALPFSGRWTVFQAFDGAMTHKGNHRHAYDFIITDEGGSHHHGSGAQLSDWYAYGKPVLAPVRGRVVKCVSQLPDNPIGKPDSRNNWGNLVILWDERGFYVELSHFAEKSLQVKEGDWVEKGAILGLCGNSGFSGEPHIHLQVQAIEVVGAYTLPFCFSAWRDGDRVETAALPREGARIRPVRTEERLKAAFSFALDEPMRWRWTRGGQQGEVACTALMAADGTRCLECGQSRVYYSLDDDALICLSYEGSRHSFPAHFFLALSRLPLVEGARSDWCDDLPAHLVLDAWPGQTAAFMAMFHHPLGLARADYRCLGGNAIEGQFSGPVFEPTLKTRVELDAEDKLATIQVGKTRWTRLPS